MSDLTGDWDKLNNILNPARLKAKLHGAAAKVGNYGVTTVKKGIVEGKNFAPNHPYTAAKKGSSKPLIDKGDLIGSVNYEVFDNANAVFVGFLSAIMSGKRLPVLLITALATKFTLLSLTHGDGSGLRSETA